MTKLQVPINNKDLAGLKKRAQGLGFDSVQAYIRVWAKAEIEGRKLNFEIDDWGEPSDAAAARINKAAEEVERGINVSGPFYTAKDALKHLNSL